MTVDELLEINPNLGDVAKYMATHPDIPVRFWDNGTVDITIPERSNLRAFIDKFRCPSCDEPTTGPTMGNTNDIRGTFRECPRCGIRYFIHNSVKFGGSY